MDRQLKQEQVNHQFGQFHYSDSEKIPEPAILTGQKQKFTFKLSPAAVAAE
jgi:hypothetical protein